MFSEEFVCCTQIVKNKTFNDLNQKSFQKGFTICSDSDSSINASLPENNLLSNKKLNINQTKEIELKLVFVFTRKVRIYVYVHIKYIFSLFLGEMQLKLAF